MNSCKVSTNAIHLIKNRYVGNKILNNRLLINNQNKIIYNQINHRYKDIIKYKVPNFYYPLCKKILFIIDLPIFPKLQHLIIVLYL